MSRRDARAYLRSLAAQHLAFVSFALGCLVSFAGLPGAGGPLIVAGVVVWTLALFAGIFRAVRRNPDKPLFGGDGMMAESTWWLGWAPMAEAAAATNRDAQKLRRMAIASLVVGDVSVALWFPVAALASRG